MGCLADIVSQLWGMLEASPIRVLDLFDDLSVAAKFCSLELKCPQA